MLGSNVNQLALAAAATTVGDLARIAEEKKKNHDAKVFTAKAFASMGYEVIPSDANFMMVNIKRDVKAFKAECIKKGVAVGRPFPPLTTYVRVSMGTMAEMQKAVDVFQARSRGERGLSGPGPGRRRLRKHPAAVHCRCSRSQRARARQLRQGRKAATVRGVLVALSGLEYLRGESSSCRSVTALWRGGSAKHIHAGRAIAPPSHRSPCGCILKTARSRRRQEMPRSQPNLTSLLQAR